MPSGGAWSTFENAFGGSFASSNGALVKLIPSAVLGAHRLYQSTSFIGEGIFSFEAKAAEYSVVVVTNSPNAWVYFNLADGTMSSLGTGWVNAGMSPPDLNGVRRCWAKSVNQTWGRVDVGVSSTMSGSGASGPSFSGNAASGVFVGNLMLENVTGTNRTTPSDYVDSTVKNRRGFSNDFTNPAWAKGVVSVYPGMAVLPDGTPATLLVPSTTSGLQGIYISSTVTAGATHTDRLVFKYAGVRYIQLTLSSSEVAGNPRANFDLLSGVVTATDAGITPGITPLGNGFYELSVTYVAALSVATIWPIFIPSPTSARAASFAGDGVSGVYIAQAGLVPGSVPSYSYNAAAAPAVGPLYAQRMDHDVSTISGIGPDLLGGIGTFDAATGWTLESGMSVSGGVLVATGAISKNAVSTAPVVATRSYIATWDQVGTGVNDTRINIKSPLDNIQVGGAYINGTGPKFAVFTASVSGSFALFNYAGGATYDNLIVKEIIFASKGALIEPTQVTQLLANPDDLSASPWGGSIVCTDDGTKFRGRRFWKCAKTTTGTSECRQNTGAGFTSGYFTAGLAFLASSNCAFVDFGLLGGTSTWGNAGDTTCSIDSGPGTLIQVSGGLWRLSGLSTNVPTVVTVVRNLLVAETASVFVYPDGTGSTTIGKAIYVQVDNLEAGTSPTSFIPNPATSGTVVRVADTSSVGYDDLCKALPWLMDTNIIPAANVESFETWTKIASGTASLPIVTANDTTYAAPDGTFTADKVVFNAGAGVAAADESSIDSSSIVTVTGAAYTGSFRVMGSAGTQLMLRHVGGSAYGLITCSGLGIWDEVPGRTEIAGTTSSTMSIGIRQGLVGTINSTATVWLWGAKLNPGPVAQTYYPQSSKQGTIVFEGDMSFGPASGGMSAFALENGASNRVEAYKGATSSNLSGLVNANSGAAGVIASGVPFKVAIGFSPASAGVSMNGSAEAPITPTAFAANPNVLKIGNDAVGSAASSMHLRALKILNVKPLLSTQLSALSR